MTIGDVIKKYRKNKGMTQEEMAGRLCVSAPAVNKWENGNSNPDIELLGPIARLLHISLDTLMSFREELTEAEIREMIRQMDKMFETEGYEKVYEWALERIREYPNCNMLIWQMAVMLDAKRLTSACAEPEKYDRQINAWYEMVLHDEKEEIRHHAADALYGFYIRKKEYAKAEEYLRYFSDQDPMKKIALGRLYQEQGKTDEAYEMFEISLFSQYQILVFIFSFMIELALEEGNREKACFLAEKTGALSRTFEIAEDKDWSSVLNAACKEKHTEGIYQAVDQILKNANGTFDLKKSRLFQHVRFSKPDNSFHEAPESTILYQAAVAGAGSCWRKSDNKK